MLATGAYLNVNCLLQEMRDSYLYKAGEAGDATRISTEDGAMHREGARETDE
jgi:hypothetical protein